MKFILFISLITLNACGTVAKYVEPIDQEAGSFIEFAMDDTDGNQFYYIYPNKTCEATEGYGQSANMLKTWGMGGKPVTKAVFPNQKIHILGVSIKRYDLGLYTNEVTCSKYAEITPEKNKTYSVKFTANQSSCGMKLVNKSTGDAPSSYLGKQIPLSCGKHID